MNGGKSSCIMINPIGGPGRGKSTFALWLCQHLKKSGVLAEFVPEIVKYEVFSSDGVERVRSGRFDGRYLMLQHGLTRPLLGAVEVIVNDGALEPFLFYARQRIPAERLPAFEDRLRCYRQEQASVEHRFVAPQGAFAYQSVGRHQTEEEARRVHEGILATLLGDFGILPQALNEKDAASYAEELASEVLARRPVAPRRHASKP